MREIGENRMKSRYTDNRNPRPRAAVNMEE